MCIRDSSSPEHDNGASGPGLASRTEVRRAVHECLAPDEGAATPAGTAFAAVGVERPLEEATGTVDVDVERVEARATLPQRLEHDVAGMLDQPPEGRLRERRGLALAMSLGAPQRLVRIDVADAREEGLIKQGPFDRGVAHLQPRDDGALVEGRLQRVRGDVGDGRWDARGSRRPADAVS